MSLHNAKRESLDEQDRHGAARERSRGELQAVADLKDSPQRNFNLDFLKWQAHVGAADAELDGTDFATASKHESSAPYLVLLLELSRRASPGRAHVLVSSSSSDSALAPWLYIWLRPYRQETPSSMHLR